MNHIITGQKEQQPKNITAIVFGILLLFVCGFTIYTYVSFDMIKRGDLKTKYIYKDNIDFHILPKHMQDKYIEKTIYTSQLKEANSKIQKAKLENQKANSEIQKANLETQKENLKIQKLELEIQKFESKIEKFKLKLEENKQRELKFLEKEAKREKRNYKEIDSYSCYSMIDGGLSVSKECGEKLNLFLDMNKDAKMFKVIGVIDETEFALITRIKYFEDNTAVNKLSKLAHLGLARKRVIDATQIIKEQLGIHTNIQFEDYMITSKKNLSGFIIRAYDL